MESLEHGYGTASKETAWTWLFNLDGKWGEKYPVAVKPWQGNWGRHTEYFQFVPGYAKPISLKDAEDRELSSIINIINPHFI